MTAMSKGTSLFIYTYQKRPSEADNRIKIKPIAMVGISFPYFLYRPT
jgi:hypothetical protein